MKYSVDRSAKSFRKGVKLANKRGWDLEKLDNTITLLASGEIMPSWYKDHVLKGDYAGYRECHVEGEADWLLIYKKHKNTLILSLTGTGTHSDLFKGY